MANTKSAKKKIEVIKRNTERNKKNKTEIKTLKKKAEAAIETNDEKKDSIIKTFIARLDSAVSKGLYHKRTAARYKSRMAKKAKATK